MSGPVLNGLLRQGLPLRIVHRIQSNVPNEGMKMQSTGGPPQQKGAFIQICDGFRVVEIVARNREWKEGEFVHRSSFVVGKVGQHGSGHEGLDVLCFIRQGQAGTVQLEGQGMATKPSQDGFSVLDLSKNVHGCFLVKRSKHMTGHGFRRLQRRTSDDQPGGAL